jgi:hypothetical protein
MKIRVAALAFTLALDGVRTRGKTGEELAAQPLRRRG